MATVSATGLATAVAAGTTSISATFSGIAGSAALTVTPTLKSVAITPAAASITAGQTEQFGAIATYRDGSTKDVSASATWSSLAAGVATVSSTGLATAVAAGTTSISATLSGISGSASLIVSPALKSVAVAPATTSLAVGQTQQFAATATYSDGSTKDVSATATWASSMAGVASVSATGLATAVGTGTTTISATVMGIAGSASVTISLALKSVAVAPATTSLAVGQTQQFSATATYSDGSTKDVSATATWASSGADVATVSVTGVATALTAGTTTISATFSGISGSASLIVSPTIKSIAVTPTAPSFAVGSTQQFSAIATFSDGSTQDVTETALWASSFNSTVTITKSGLATAKSSGVVAISATVSGVSGSVPILITIPTQQPPLFSVYGNATDPHLIRETLSDGSLIDYFGSKDSNGFATSITTVVLTRTSGTSTVISYNADELPTTMHGSGGGTILIQWSSATEGTVTEVSADGKARIGPAQFTLPSSANASINGRAKPLANILEAVRYKEAQVRTRDDTSSLPITSVNVTRCSDDRPAQYATVYLRVSSSARADRIYVNNSQSQPGVYDFSLPLPDPNAGLSAEQKCDAFETTSAVLCKANGSLQAIDTVLVATLAASGILLPEAVGLEILAAEFNEIVGPTCEIIDSTPPGGSQTYFQTFCKGVGALVDGYDNSQLTLSPLAFLLDGGDGYPAPPQVVPADNPSTTFSINANDTGDCETLSVKVTPSPADVALGFTLPLTAQAYDGDFDPVSDIFAWTSDITSVAQVDPNSGTVTGEAPGHATVTATASNGVSGSTQVTVGASSFWQGSYQITSCSAPGAIGTGGANAYCNLVMSWPSGPNYSSGQMSFRSGSTETFNFRRDYTIGGSSTLAVCKADSISVSPTSSGFTESTYAEASYGTAGSYDPNTVTYTITSSTPQAISGTFTAPVPYLDAQTGSQSDWVTGSLQGTWQVTPLSAAFPKCIPPSSTNLYCQDYNGGENTSPPDGTIVPCAQPFLPLSSPARPGEWQGLP